jgi:hypothetical protein
MFEVIKAYRETDKIGDGKTIMQRNGQTRTGRRDRYAHSGQGRRQIPRLAGEAACWQIKIYIEAEIQIHAGIIQKPTDKMVTTDTV